MKKYLVLLRGRLGHIYMRFLLKRGKQNTYIFTNISIVILHVYMKGGPIRGSPLNP